MDAWGTSQYANKRYGNQRSQSAVDKLSQHLFQCLIEALCQPFCFGVIRCGPQSSDSQEMVDLLQQCKICYTISQYFTRETHSSEELYQTKGN